jgi:hypothetical protein
MKRLNLAAAILISYFALLLTSTPYLYPYYFLGKA